MPASDPAAPGVDTGAHRTYLGGVFMRSRCSEVPPGIRACLIDDRYAFGARPLGLLGFPVEEVHPSVRSAVLLPRRAVRARLWAARKLGRLGPRRLFQHGVVIVGPAIGRRVARPHGGWRLLDANDGNAVSRKEDAWTDAGTGFQAFSFGRQRETICYLFTYLATVGEVDGGSI